MKMPFLHIKLVKKWKLKIATLNFIHSSLGNSYWPKRVIFPGCSPSETLSPLAILHLSWSITRRVQVHHNLLISQPVGTTGIWGQIIPCCGGCLVHGGSLQHFLPVALPQLWQAQMFPGLKTGRNATPTLEWEASTGLRCQGEESVLFISKAKEGSQETTLMKWTKGHMTKHHHSTVNQFSSLQEEGTLSTLNC